MAEREKSSGRDETGYRGPPVPDARPQIIMSILDDGSDHPDYRRKDTGGQAAALTQPGQAAEEGRGGGEASPGHEAEHGGEASSTGGMGDSGGESSSPDADAGHSESRALGADPPPEMAQPGGAAHDPVGIDPLAGVYSPRMREQITREAWNQAGGEAQDRAIADRAGQIAERGEKAIEPAVRDIHKIVRERYADRPEPPLLDVSPEAQASRIKALNGAVPPWFRARLHNIQTEQHAEPQRRGAHAPEKAQETPLPVPALKRNLEADLAPQVTLREISEGTPHASSAAQISASMHTRQIHQPASEKVPTQATTNSQRNRGREMNR